MSCVYFFLIIAMIFTQINAAQQQKFKATPHDLQVLEGSEAVLRCEVSNLAGQVQWTKDGFALGKFFTCICFLIFCCCFFLPLKCHIKLHSESQVE